MPEDRLLDAWGFGRRGVPFQHHGLQVLAPHLQQHAPQITSGALNLRPRNPTKTSEILERSGDKSLEQLRIDWKISRNRGQT